MMIDRPGIYPDMLAAEYFADPTPTPSLTQSIAKVLISKSPLHAMYEHPRLRGPTEEEPEAYSKALAIGNAAHSLMLGRGKTLEIADFDSWRTKAAQNVRDDAVAAGKTPILQKHYETAVQMMTAAQDQLSAAGFENVFSLDDGQAEVCIAWEEDGIWFRSLIDWLPHDRLIGWDLKTTELSCAPHAITRLMVDGGWALQAAFHRRGLRALMRPGDDDVKSCFRFVALEQQPPFCLSIVELSEDVMIMGEKQLEYAVALWRRSMTTGKWPGYSLKVQTPQYPSWAERSWLEREIHEAGQERLGDRDASNLMAG